MDRLYRVLIVVDTDGDANQVITDIFEAGASAQEASIAEIGIREDVVKADLAFFIDAT